MNSTRGLMLLDKHNKHEPGFAVPKRFYRGLIDYEFDVAPPPWPDAGWGMLLLAKHPGRKDPFLSRWTGPYRPTADMERWFLKSAIEGSERFFSALAGGEKPEQAQMVAQLSHAREKRAQATVINQQTGHSTTLPWLLDLRRR